MSRKTLEESLIASEAETLTSCYGVLAGLVFTASMVIFQFRTSLPLGDWFLTLSLVTTTLFISAVVSSSSASSVLRSGRTQEAKRYLAQADYFAIVGFVTILVEISFLAFSAGLQYGVVVVGVIIIAMYLMKKY